MSKSVMLMVKYKCPGFPDVSQLWFMWGLRALPDWPFVGAAGVSNPGKLWGDKWCQPLTDTA